MGDIAAISAGQRRALARLNEAGLLRSVYLVGGVAVALHLGHRRSVDLDLFSRTPTLDLDALGKEAVRSLDATTVARSDAALALLIGRVPVDVVRYPFRRLERLTAGPEGVEVAGLRDLAAMKIAAIARRGIRRDFWDLHEILTRTRRTFGASLDDYRRKFGRAESDLYHVLRGMSWFEDAEADRSPPGLTAAHWREIRAWFEERVAKELARRTR